MLKRSSVILSIVLGIVVFFSCSKSNHNTLVLLGDESYLKSIDDVYPRSYRNEWPTIAPSYYYINSDNEVAPKPNEGLFPPDLTGEYDLKLQYISGLFSVNFNGNYINIPGSDKVMRIKISNQKNSFADLEFRLNNKSYPNEGAYIYGTVDPDDPNKGEITICFEYSEVYAEFGDVTMTNFYGCMLTGEYYYGYIKNARLWMVINGRSPVEEMNYSYLLGGQQFYIVGN